MGEKTRLAGTTTALLAAASPVMATTGDGDDMLFGITSTPEITAETLPDQSLTADLIGDAQTPLFTPLPQGEPWLVAEQHDGTWVGGVGRDVISTTKPRTRLRDQLTRGNMAGGLALLAGLAWLGWTALRRRRRG